MKSLVALALVAFLVPAADARAQDAPISPPAPASDPSLDELLEIPNSKPAEKPEAPMDTTLEDEPGGEPFELAVEGMKEASALLNEKKDASISTQRVQEQVVRRLDTIIAQVRRNQNQQKKQQQRQQDSGSQQQDSQEQQQQGEEQQPGQEPATGTGKRGQVKTGQPGDEPLNEEFNEWGNLPPRLRDQLRNGLKDTYSNLYEDLTERYYRRLAEESP